MRRRRINFNGDIDVYNYPTVLHYRNSSDQIKKCT